MADGGLGGHVPAYLPLPLPVVIGPGELICFFVSMDFFLEGRLL
jgi:hypothetical protein